MTLKTKDFVAKNFTLSRVFDDEDCSEVKSKLFEKVKRPRVFPKAMLKPRFFINYYCHIA